MKHFFYSKFLKTILPRLLFISLLSLTLLPTSCRKDDEEDVVPLAKVYAEENPLAAFYVASGMTKIIDKVNSGYYESAIVFSPNVKGKINAVTLKIPDVATNTRVTIWDYDSKAVLRTILIDVTSSHTTFTKAIEPLNLEKDKQYMISMNTNDWFQNKKPDGSYADYPVVAGNIKFLGCKWSGGSAQVFPTVNALNFNAGDVSFVFQQVD